MSELGASWAAARCALRGVPLFFRSTPGTPLRVLAIVALDTVHVLRTSRPLSRRRLDELAAVLDFQACTNAAWDGKPWKREEHLALLHRLEAAGRGVYLEDYLARLRALESGRPPIGGSFEAARAYREGVVRVSLATVTAVALDLRSVEDAKGEAHADGNLDALFRMSMLCQVIDDVLDEREDRAAGLPSFLTLGSLEETAEAARSYAAVPRCALSLRVALRIVAALTRLFLWRFDEHEVADSRCGGALGDGAAPPEVRHPSPDGARTLRVPARRRL